MKHRYSPYPIESYFIPGASICEFRVIAQCPVADAAWNYFWLSLPTVDSLPTATPKGYWRNYVSWPAMIKALVDDVVCDEKLQEMLTKSPATFHAWFCAEPDYTVYDAWDVGGPQWVETVAMRADEAAMSRLTQRPLIFARDRVLRLDLRSV